MKNRIKIIDAADWLGADSQRSLERPEAYRTALRIAQCIEYGGPIPRSHAVATLISCRRRPDNQACRGLMQVVKTEIDELHVFCPACGAEEFLICNWESSAWALGPPEPVEVEEITPPTSDDLPPNVRAQLLRVLAPYRVDADELVALIADAPTPASVIEAVTTRRRPSDIEDMQRLLDAIQDAWNHVPRPELEGRTPTEVYFSQPRQPAVAARAPGRNEPCPCGSGRKFKRCCLN